ncbi:kinase-like domain-containing protein [Glomus cerebriforme]|uniref:Kinase-like domain-containing protein n=1 Tax=Glomus cerebriforme TaxID=658196 RepID=A0A397SC00_9GLOM|nr:kinase-like domain-containing protein [Glomus cerebriforme]
MENKSKSRQTNNEDNELSNKMIKMRLNNIETTTTTTTTTTRTRDEETIKINKFSSSLGTVKEVFNIAQNSNDFIPLIKTFLEIGSEIVTLYEKAKHNKKLCSFLLKRCNGAVAAVKDLNIRKTENVEFFSKLENLTLFKGFIDCMKKIKKFIADVSQLNRLKKYFFANRIEEELNILVKEFDGYMTSLNFSFTVQSRDEFATVKSDVKGIKEILCYAFGVSDDKQSQQNFFEGMNSITEKNKKFQKKIKLLNSSEVEENEPLLDITQYHKTNICPSKRIEKRTSYTNCEEFCFKEFSNTSSASSSSSLTDHSNNNEQTQFEIRRQVNILKELKNSAHIIRFYGVAQEDSKFYLVTEWMEHGNLHQYYTEYRDTIDWKTKIKFALDICRGVVYLDECKILHHDIQSANILVNENHKVRIANFGLSKKFSDITRNISQNLENIRYMAPEKLLLDNDDIKKGYDSKCEIYSVGALMWEIAELKKPHHDLDKSDMLVGIRKRVSENYHLPFSDDVPNEWRTIVAKAMQYDPMWRLTIVDMCRDFYFLYSGCLQDNSKGSISNGYYFKIPSVEDAITLHKSPNGNKQSAWQSFKHHSSTNIEAKYWLGYYYYHHHEEIPDLKQISKEERIKIAINIFKETADKGNPSAQLRYGMCLWKGEDKMDALTLKNIEFQTQTKRNIMDSSVDELKDSDHIINFFGLAHEESKYYLVTEWMEFGNLHEYYNRFRDTIDWNTKIKFALDIINKFLFKL